MTPAVACRGARWLSLALLCLVSAWCEPSRAEGTAVGDANAAKLALLRFGVGAQLYAEGKFQQALEQFDAARQLRPMVEAGVYRARCLSKLARWLEAYQAYELTEREVQRAGGSSSTRVSAAEQPPVVLTLDVLREEREALSSHLGFLHVQVDDVPKYTRLLVNQRNVPREQWHRVPVRPGEVDVDLRTPYRPAVRRSLKLRPGDEVKLQLQLSPLHLQPLQALSLEHPARYDSVERPEVSWFSAFAYDAAALGAVGFGAYGVYDEMSRDTLAGMDLETCQRQSCDAEQSRRAQDGAVQQLVARVGLALGLVGVGSAVTLLVLDEGDNGKTTLRLSPSGLFLHGKM